MDHGGTAPAEHLEVDCRIKVVVNDKPLTLIGNRHTGASIKQAAIEAGVPIDADFVLSLEHGNRQTTIIDDLETIEIVCDARIVAVPDDDNSCGERYDSRS